MIARHSTLGLTLLLLAACGDSSAPRLETKSGVSAGGAHCLALSAKGVLTAVGANHRGQLGVATNTFDSNFPVTVTGVPPLVLAHAGNAHSVVLAADGSVYTFGDNRYGQLGRLQPSFTSTPQRVDVSEAVVDVASGGAHVVVLARSGRVLGWGSNEQMQLGIDNIRQAIRPVHLHSETGVKGIAATDGFSALLLDDGSVLLFGRGKRVRECCWVEATKLAFGQAKLFVYAGTRIVAELPISASAAVHDCHF